VPTQSWAFLILTRLRGSCCKKTRIGRVLLLSGANSRSGERNRAAGRPGGVFGSRCSGVCCASPAFQLRAFGRQSAEPFQASTSTSFRDPGRTSRCARTGLAIQARSRRFIALLENFMC